MGPHARARVPGTARTQAPSSQSKLAGLDLSDDESDFSDSNSEDDQPAEVTRRRANDGVKPLNNADQEPPVTRARTKQPVSDRPSGSILQATRDSREGAPAAEVDGDDDDDDDDDDESFENDEVSDEITVGGDLPSQQWDRTRADIVMDRLKYMDQRELAEELVKHILAHPDEATSILLQRPDVSRPMLECIATRSNVFEATLVDVKGSSSSHHAAAAASSRDVDTTALRDNNKSRLMHSQREGNECEERMKGVTKRKSMSSLSSSTSSTSSQRQRDARTQASQMESEEGASRTLSSSCTDAQSKALSCPSSADAIQAGSDTQNAKEMVKSSSSSSSSSSSLGVIKSNDKVRGEVVPKGDVPQPHAEANEAVKGDASQSSQSSSSSLSLSSLSSTACKRSEHEAVEEGASQSSHSSSQSSSSAACHTPRARTKKVAAKSISSPWQKSIAICQSKSSQGVGTQGSLLGEEREKPLQGDNSQSGPKGTPHSSKKRNRGESTTNSEQQQQQKKKNKTSSQVIDLISSDQGSELQSSAKKKKEPEVITLY